MSNMLQDIHFDSVIVKLRAATFRQVLQHLAKEAAPYLPYQEKEILLRLQKKEVQDPSLISGGIALVHLQLNRLYRSCNILCTLQQPIALLSQDQRPVDIVCLQLSPAQDGALNLRRLARLARFFKNAELCGNLREASDTDAIVALLETPERWMYAA